MDGFQWKRVVRLISFAVGLGLWVISIVFSQSGFNIQVENMVWVGILLALAVTGAEIVFNDEGLRHNPTIVIVGLAAYAYGIFTNIDGLLAAQGTSMDEMVGRNWFGLIFPVLFAVLVEVGAEPFILYGLLGRNMFDLFSTLFFMDGKRDRPKPMHPPLPQKGGNQQPNQNNQNGGQRQAQFKPQWTKLPDGTYVPVGGKNGQPDQSR